ncbi:hypothetical protein BGX27_004828, partial [Mortierella sp. AM989]
QRQHFLKCCKIRKLFGNKNRLAPQDDDDENQAGFGENQAGYGENQADDGGN